MNDFTATRTALRQAIDFGTCLGALVRVLHHGDEVAHFAVGEAAEGTPLTVDAVLPWYSASKLPASLAVAKAWELDLLHPDEPVVRHLPEFAGPVKDEIRIKHLLSHTAPLRTIDRAIGAALDDGRDALVARILRAEADPDWMPGERAAYLGHAGYLLLDEIVARRAATSFAAFQAEHITGPLGLTSVLGGPRDAEVVDVPWFGPPELAARVGRYDARLGYPSACMAGPYGEIADLCELLRGGGRGILSSEMCSTMVIDFRSPSLVDEAAGIVRRWGFGVPVGLRNFGPAGPRGFGALGGTACGVFSDPEREVTVALYFVGNAMPADRLARDVATTTAIYEDLGIGTAVSVPTG